MAIRKIQLSDGTTRWELTTQRAGRGSKNVRRRFMTKPEAVSYASQFEVEKKKVLRDLKNGLAEIEDTTFQAEAEYWLSRKRFEFSPGYLKRVTGILKRLVPEIGHMSPMRLHVGAVGELQTRFLQNEMTPVSVNRFVETIKAVLNHSAEHRRIAYHPAATVKKLKTSKSRLEFWSEADAKAFLEFALRKYPQGSESHWIYLVYLLAMNTGLRAGEIWGLKTSELLFNEGLIHVRFQHDRVSNELRPTKGRSDRLVPCNEQLAAALESFVKTEGRDKNAFLFCNEKGNPICHDNFRNRCFEKDVAESGLKKLRFHDLRHSAATLMMSKGLEPSLVQEILGHESIQTTMIYVHVLGSNVKRAGKIFSIGPERSEPVSHLKLVGESVNAVS